MSMEQYLEHGNILNALGANLEGADHVVVWYKYLYSGKVVPIQTGLNIQLANE